MQHIGIDSLYNIGFDCLYVSIL